MHKKSFCVVVGDAVQTLRNGIYLYISRVNMPVYYRRIIDIKQDFVEPLCALGGVDEEEEDQEEQSLLHRMTVLALESETVLYPAQETAHDSEHVSFDRCMDTARLLENILRRAGDYVDNSLSRNKPPRRRDRFQEGSTVARLRGLPWSSTVEEVQEFFSGFKISTDHILIVLNMHGRSTGEAYVQFENSDECKRAFEERDLESMGSRYIEMFSSSPEEVEYMRRLMAHHLNTNSKILRMRGIPYNTTVEQIEKFFENLKLIRNGIFIVIGPDGRQTGDAFAEFDDTETVKEALKRNKEKIGTRYIELFRSSREALDNAILYSQGLYYPVSMDPYTYTRRRGGFSRGRRGYHGFPPSSMMMMPNMPFRPSRPGSMYHRRGYYDGSGRRGGRGFYRRGHYNQQHYNNETISAADQVFTENDSTLENDVQHPATGNSHILSASDVGTDFVVRIRGLPFDADEVDIAEFFQDLSIKGQGIHLVFDQYVERHTGEAYVQFEKLEDVEKALKMHKQMLGSRYIEVFQSTKQGIAAHGTHSSEQSQHNGIENADNGGARARAPTDEHNGHYRRRYHRGGRGRGGRFRRGNYGGMMYMMPNVMNAGYYQDMASYYPDMSSMTDPYSRVPIPMTPYGLLPQQGILMNGDIPERRPQTEEPMSSIKMKGMPLCSIEDIVSYFGDIKIDEQSIRFKMSPNGHPMGQVVLDCITEENAQRAFREKNNKPLNGSLVRLYFNNPNAWEKYKEQYDNDDEHRMVTKIPCGVEENGNDVQNRSTRSLTGGTRTEKEI